MSFVGILLKLKPCLGSGLVILKLSEMSSSILKCSVFMLCTLKVDIFSQDLYDSHVQEYITPSVNMLNFA